MDDRSANDPILEIENLTVDFGGFRPVDGFSMSIAQGETRVLIGPNGAGKTTTLDLISGKLKATKGIIKIKGQDITNWQEHKIARAGVGRKFQITSLFRELTVRENLEVASCRQLSVLRNLVKRVGRKVHERIEEVLELIRLQDKASRVAANISHGEAQWLELGMVLLQNPGIILLDEPTAGMTSLETEKTSGIIRGLKDNHTLIVVEHDMTFVRSICEIITVMHQGKKLTEGTVEEVEKVEAVTDAYLGSKGIGHA